MKVIKRDGRVVDYNKEKIVCKPLDNCGGKGIEIIPIDKSIFKNEYNVLKLYNSIMKKEQFLLLSLYLSICLYLLVTHDLSFNLLLHNLNIFELIENGFGFYLIVQISLKIIILYLIYKMIIAIKNRNKIL